MASRAKEDGTVCHPHVVDFTFRDVSKIPYNFNIVNELYQPFKHAIFSMSQSLLNIDTVGMRLEPFLMNGSHVL